MQDRRSPTTETRRIKSSIVEKNWNEVRALEADLEAYLSNHGDLNDPKVEQNRWKIKHRYENIILADPKFCAENNIELLLWKAAFYKFIESYRKDMEENAANLEAKSALLKLVDEGNIFFESLQVKLQDSYDFSIEKYVEHEYDPEEPGYDRFKLIAISAQKLIMCLGDLARYKELAAGTTGFGKARRYTVL